MVREWNEMGFASFCFWCSPQGCYWRKRRGWSLLFTVVSKGKGPFKVVVQKLSVNSFPFVSPVFQWQWCWLFSRWMPICSSETGKSKFRTLSAYSTMLAVGSIFFPDLWSRPEPYVHHPRGRGWEKMETKVVAVLNPGCFLNFVCMV